MNVASAAADVLVVCGPTAAGKSAVAMWLASRRPTTILSADSRQIYRGFDIGTAKPSKEERVAVPHWGVDIVEPTVRYSAAAWAAAAEKWIERSREEGRTPLIVGGTGLYMRALFEGLFHEPPLDPLRRLALSKALESMSLDDLRRWVQRLDPARSHLGRTQLLRSIEIALLTGRRLSELHRDRAHEPRWQPRYLLVDPGPALAGRIAARIDEMLEHGWADEVSALIHLVPENAPAWNASGYGAIRSLVEGTITRAAAVERILIETRQYAKRQRTWFRHQLPSDRVSQLDPLAHDWRSVSERWADPHAAERHHV